MGKIRFERRTTYYTTLDFNEVIGVVDNDDSLWLKDELDGDTLHHEGPFRGLRSEVIMDAGRWWEDEVRFRRAERVARQSLKKNG